MQFYAVFVSSPATEKNIFFHYSVVGRITNCIKIIVTVEHLYLYHSLSVFSPNWIRQFDRLIGHVILKISTFQFRLAANSIISRCSTKSFQFFVLFVRVFQCETHTIPIAQLTTDIITRQSRAQPTTRTHYDETKAANERRRRKAEKEYK